MRITILTGPWHPVPPLRGGAVERMWQGLAEEFARRGHRVTFLSRSFSGLPIHEMTSGVRYIRRGGFQIGNRLSANLLKDLVYTLRMIAYLPRADIFLVNSFWFPFLSRILDARRGIMVLDVNRYPKGQFRYYPKTVWYAAASSAIRDAIATESESAATRTRVVSNALDTLTFSPGTDSPAERGAVILYVGRVHPEKGVHLLIDAFRQVQTRHPDARLRIAGPVAVAQGGGGGDYDRKLRREAEGLPVEFLGPVFDKKELAECYRSADVFCYPSLAERGEAFGVAPVEAMACGVVPVVSDLAVFKDFIRHEETGFVFDHRGEDPAGALAKTLSDILADPGLRSRVSAAALDESRQYSFESVAAQFLSYFEDLLKGTSRVSSAIRTKERATP